MITARSRIAQIDPLRHPLADAMSTEDLAILADALTFALLMGAGGLIAWLVIRGVLRRPGVGQSVKVGLSAAALVVVGLAAVAQWPTARDVVDPGSDGEGDPSDQPTTAPTSAVLIAPDAPTMSPSGGGRPDFVEGSSSAGTRSNASNPGGPPADPSSDPSAEPDPGDDPSPGPDPSPTPDPSPSPDPSPEPSPSPSPSPSDSPSDQPGGGPPGDPPGGGPPGDPPGQT